MSYHIHTTPGIILSSRPLREADRVYSILTRDLGLVRATASGVRKEASKLRGALEPFAFATVSLVRGKEYWRLTSAEHLERLPRSAEVARPFALLERLVPEEEKQAGLFDAVAEAFESALDEKFEVSLVARILYQLGYLKEEDLALEKSKLIAAINRGLESSHLI